MSTKNYLGVDVEAYKKWKEFQKTPLMNCSNIDIYHVEPIWLFYLTNNEKMREAINWKHTQTLSKEVHQNKRTKLNLLDFSLQFY